MSSNNLSCIYISSLILVREAGYGRQGRWVEQEHTHTHLRQAEKACDDDDINCFSLGHGLRSGPHTDWEWW